MPPETIPAPPAIAGAQRRTVAIRTADAGTLDIRVYEAGAGPPVLMLHGWPQDAFCWRYVIPRLADRYRLVAPDLRGFGESAAPAGGYDGLTFASDAIALLDALGIERAHLIGHDWGGFAAFAAALEAPERIASLVALNTIPPWVRPSPRLAFEAWRAWYVVMMAVGGERIVRERPELIAKMLRGDRIHDGISRADAEAYAARLRRPESARASQLLYRSYLRAFRGVLLERRFADARLTVPTRFLFGTNDLAISHHLLDGVEDHGDDLTVELVHDSGHFIPEEKPELVAERAAALFARHPVVA